MEELSLDGRHGLVVCVADGAGSANFSHFGAERACSTFRELIARDGSQLSADGGVFSRLAISWCHEIRSAIEHEAIARNVALRQLACTFIGAIVLEEQAFFLQVGDGAVVVHFDEGFEAVCWPQSGEYANTTNFITDNTIEDLVFARALDKRVSKLAMFTDGLERLILRFADEAVHEPFLLPLFESLKSATDERDLCQPLHDWLQSDPVNERTDDDKTLVLALRDEDKPWQD